MEKEASSIIIDNCQDILFGGFAQTRERRNLIKSIGNNVVWFYIQRKK